jgi:hypothetical protein
LDELEKKFELSKIDEYWEGHLRDEGGIMGDVYEFEGDLFDIIIVGKNKGIYKNDKKMTKKEFKKLPFRFTMSLRPIPDEYE